MQLQDLNYELCRPGILLYGQTPVKHVEGADEFEQVMSLKANIVHLKEIAVGDSVSYGRTFMAQEPTLVATLPLGYADGLRRSLSNKSVVIINGKYAPVIGRICMDQTMIDVTGIDGVKIGDEVIIIGTEGNKSITAEQIAEYAETISYEILCGISPRVPREYINT
jgi:alanine racemase